MADDRKHEITAVSRKEVTSSVHYVLNAVK